MSRSCMYFPISALNLQCWQSLCINREDALSPCNFWSSQLWSTVKSATQSIDRIYFLKLLFWLLYWRSFSTSNRSTSDPSWKSLLVLVMEQILEGLLWLPPTFRARNVAFDTFAGKRRGCILVAIGWRLTIFCKSYCRLISAISPTTITTCNNVPRNFAARYSVITNAVFRIVVRRMQTVVLVHKLQ